MIGTFEVIECIDIVTYYPVDLLMRNKLLMVAGNLAFIEGMDISNLRPFCSSWTIPDLPGGGTR